MLGPRPLKMVASIFSFTRERRTAASTASFLEEHEIRVEAAPIMGPESLLLLVVKGYDAERELNS
jgi:hypothetical protein